jgi:hypothetical protein
MFNGGSIWYGDLLKVRAVYPDANLDKVAKIMGFENKDIPKEEEKEKEKEEIPNDKTDQDNKLKASNNKKEYDNKKHTD